MPVKITGTIIETRQGTGSDCHVEMGDPTLVCPQAGTGVEDTLAVDC
jgi:hypothetical protein